MEITCACITKMFIYLSEPFINTINKRECVAHKFQAAESLLLLQMFIYRRFENKIDVIHMNHLFRDFNIISGVVS